jgi:hypothetical protein
MKCLTIFLSLLIISSASDFLKHNEHLSDIDRGLTQHFSDWLTANGYGNYHFERTDLVGGAYGGKQSDSDKLKQNPIVFFHGNSDIAVGTVDLFTGFTKSIEYFIS